MRKAEGLDLVVGMLAGKQQPSVELEVKGMRFRVDLLNGHKTGLYLNQSDTTKPSQSLPMGCGFSTAFPIRARLLSLVPEPGLPP